MANDLISPVLVMEPPHKSQIEGFRELPDGELGGAGRVAPREGVGAPHPFLTPSQGISSTWLFHSRVLYDKPVNISKMFP